MRRNVRNQRAESRTVQKSVQILLVVSGVVFLALGLALAVTGTSVDSAVGSVSDQLGDADAPDDGSSPASDDADGAGDETSGDAGNDTDGDADGSDGDSGDDDGNGGDDGNDGTTGGDGDDSDSADDGDPSDGDSGDGDDADGGDDTDSDGTQTLTTVVEDGEGNAVDNATVTVTGDGSSERRVVDGDGEAEFDLADGQYTVTANADGYDAAESTVEIDGDDETVTLTLESADDSGDDSNDSNDSNDSDDSSDADDGSGDGASDSDDTQTLTVVVEDGEGNAVDNATVTVAENALFSTGSEKQQGVDDDGEAVFDLANGEYEVTAEADGYETATDSVEIDGSDETITLILEED